MKGRVRVFKSIAAVVAVTAGILTLLGYFAPPGLVQVVAVRLALVSLVSLLAAWAVLAGALNLVTAHARRFAGQAPGWLYSLFVVLGFVAVLVANGVAPLLDWGRGLGNAANQWLLIYPLAAGGAALAALVAFFLLFAGYRVLRQQPTPMLVVFVATAVLALLAAAPWPALLPNPTLLAGTSLRDALRAVTQVPALAATRGLLLGVALGSIATGLRLLLGLDRPYGE
jgi:hypothetical protein